MVTTTVTALPATVSLRGGQSRTWRGIGTIGTLDVALKKRFFALSGEDDAPGAQNDGNGSQKININSKNTFQYC